jgi:hypothetical protein
MGAPTPTARPGGPVRAAATVIDLASTPTRESACLAVAPSRARMQPRPRADIGPVRLEFQISHHLQERAFVVVGHVYMARSRRLNAERIPPRLPCS